MPDYTNTIIYKICSKDPNITDIYVGSTCNFTKRKAMHKFVCNTETTKEYNYKVYTFIRENGGWDSFEMIPIEKFPCRDKVEKTIRERYWYEFLKAILNTRCPNRTNKEWRIDNSATLKAKKKEYQTENADTIKEYKKIYYTENVDKIKAQKATIVVCECGSSVRHDIIARHRKSKKHENNMFDIHETFSKPDEHALMFGEDQYDEYGMLV